MDLDYALQLIASRIARRGEQTDLSSRARAVLLELLRDHSGPLADTELEEIARWLRQEWSAASDPAGSLYQELLKRTVGVRHGQVEVRRERGAHRATGAYYTLAPVVDYMLARVKHFAPEVRSVVDPACGAGAFLVGARRHLGDGLARLTGFDSDPLAAAICKQNVPGAEVQVVDALLSPAEGEYDLCVGNPPYISGGLRGAPAQDRAWQERVRQRFPMAAQYKLNTYPLFVERGLELVRSGGLLAYILPDSFLTGRYFTGLRRLLLSHTLLELTMVAEDFWQHGRVGQSVILIVRKGRLVHPPDVAINRVANVAELGERRVVQLPLQEVVWGGMERFRLLPDPADRKFVQLMEGAAQREALGTHLQSYSGLIARHGQRSLIRGEQTDQAGPWGRLLRSGREIDRYQLTWAGAEVWLQPSLIKSGGRISYYTSPKLLLRQTADSLRAVYDDQGYFCLNNIHLLLPRSDDVDLKAFLGLINSGPVNRYYRLMAMEAGRLYAQVDLDLFESLPIPLISCDAAARLHKLVVQRENAAIGEAALLDAQLDQLVANLYGLSLGQSVACDR